MTTTSLWCSASNPADGTAVTTSNASIAALLNGGTSTKIWRTASASQANTGIQFINQGTGTNEFRTTAFGTPNLSVAYTGVFTTPPSNPSSPATPWNARSTGGVIARMGWGTSGQLTFTPAAGGLVSTICAAGVLAASTRYIIQMWFTVATATTGLVNIKVTDLSGTVKGTLTLTNSNLGTAAFSQFDLDQDTSITCTYSWAEVIQNDGGTAFIAPYVGVSAPVANAGPDQTVDPVTTVTLAGSGTNSPTSRLWTQTSGTSVTLSSTTIDGPTFTSPADPAGQSLVFSLTETNAGGTSSPDTVTITVNPQIRWIAGASTWNPTNKIQLV